ncbi:hypothetical protein [Rubellimicrobium mesophilum]|uniref:hypothetical protein n=1 Tax=Rubellimicrobium mesophilum TaxID=1123067 RepID=UPI00056162F3|nr:hypothetical protein [Rubellimicrobium mesophilum]
MPTAQTTTTTAPSEAAAPIRSPGLTPMERQLLEQVARLERERRDRDARHTAEVALLRMELASLNGTVARLTMWLGALLDPEAPSGS